MIELFKRHSPLITEFNSRESQIKGKNDDQQDRMESKKDNGEKIINTKSKDAKNSDETCIVM